MVRKYSRRKKKQKVELTKKKPLVEPASKIVAETKVAMPGLFCPRCGEGMILQKEGDMFTSTEYKCPKCGKVVAKM